MTHAKWTARAFSPIIGRVRALGETCVLRSIALLSLAWLAILASPAAPAQTTDGYHAMQVFPVVVDTGSFAQRFTFRNPNPGALTLRPRYFPAQGTTATAITCPDLVVPATSSTTVASLRLLCPALPAGSQFGFLTVRAASDDVRVFAGFSRVANPQGQGFSVEAFAPHVFTSATSVVNGIRRKAATGGAPAFQTNCFVGNLEDVAPGATPPVTPVQYRVFSSAGTELGTGTVNLAPGQMQRLLDVFAVAPAGDYDDARVSFEELGADEPGILAFCTVQDNTSFGADFRVAKQEFPGFGEAAQCCGVAGARDAGAARLSIQDHDVEDRLFELPVSGNYRNAHLVYMRHPDTLMCELQSNWTTPSQMNVELRVTALDGTVLGPEFPTYTGAAFTYKSEHGNGANTPVIVEVEDGDSSILFPAFRRYTLYCRSGSGHTLGELVEYQQSPDRF
jgi:hypothetical protein